MTFYFLKEFNQTYRRERSLSPEVIEALYKYDFPGNIRELANLIEMIVVIGEKDQIEIMDLPKIITGSEAKTTAYPFFSEDIPLREAMEQFERMIIEKTMKRYGSQREVAKVLEVDQATISRKLKKFVV